MVIVLNLEIVQPDAEKVGNPQLYDKAVAAAAPAGAGAPPPVENGGAAGGYGGPPPQQQYGGGPPAGGYGGAPAGGAPAGGYGGAPPGGPAGYGGGPPAGAGGYGGGPPAGPGGYGGAAPGGPYGGGAPPAPAQYGAPPGPQYRGSGPGELANQQSTRCWGGSLCCGACLQRCIACLPAASAPCKASAIPASPLPPIRLPRPPGACSGTQRGPLPHHAHQRPQLVPKPVDHQGARHTEERHPSVRSSAGGGGGGCGGGGGGGWGCVGVCGCGCGCVCVGGGDGSVKAALLQVRLCDCRGGRRRARRLQKGSSIRRCVRTVGVGSCVELAPIAALPARSQCDCCSSLTGAPPAHPFLPFPSYSNARGEGRFFSFDLLDAQGGEIRVVGWNDQVGAGGPGGGAQGGRGRRWGRGRR